MGSEYSSRTAAQTLEWIEAIVRFLKPYTFLSNAHVVNFFKDKLWEALDKDWIACLSREPIQNLLLIPSGIVQAHWPASLKEFVSTVRSLSLPQRQANLEKILPNVHITSLGPVLAQGMNVKKKHEVEVLSAIVDSIARSVKAQTIVDVGAGQGYLSQVLAFQYDLSVIAIDASSHHAKVAEARAERIRKHYAAQIHKQQSFSKCEDIKAVVSLGCCYNLLSEEDSGTSGSEYGFPMSNAVRCAGVCLGKSSRDLACQSADRWRILGDESGIHNFDLHAFRAAFQMVLDKHYPEISSTHPSIGRQGKSLRRQKLRGSLKSWLDPENVVPVSLDGKQFGTKAEVTRESSETNAGDNPGIRLDQNRSCFENTPSNNIKFDGIVHTDMYPLFEKFCHSGLCRLGLGPLPDMKLRSIWNEIEPFTGLVGPYWSLRAALGPLLETLILLDRLLYLQEQGSQVEAFILPIFDPVTSPRNVAIIAKKV